MKSIVSFWRSFHPAYANAYRAFRLEYEDKAHAPGAIFRSDLLDLWNAGGEL